MCEYISWLHPVRAPKRLHDLQSLHAHASHVADMNTACLQNGTLKSIDELIATLNKADLPPSVGEAFPAAMQMPGY